MFKNFAWAYSACHALEVARLAAGRTTVDVCNSWGAASTKDDYLTPEELDYVLVHARAIEAQYGPVEVPANRDIQGETP